MKRNRPKTQKVFFDHNGFLPDWKNKREVIHHKDNNPLNNEPNNLVIMTQSEHVKLHKPMKGKHHSIETKLLFSNQKKGNKNRLGILHEEKTKEKIGESCKIWWDSKEGEKIKQSRKINHKLHSIESKEKMSKGKKTWWDSPAGLKRKQEMRKVKQCLQK